MGVRVTSQQELDSLLKEGNLITLGKVEILGFKAQIPGTISCGELRAHNLEATNLYVDGLCQVSDLHCSKLRCDSFEGMYLWADDIRANSLRAKEIWASVAHYNHIICFDRNFGVSKPLPWPLKIKSDA